MFTEKKKLNIKIFLNKLYNQFASLRIWNILRDSSAKAIPVLDAM